MGLDWPLMSIMYFTLQHEGDVISQCHVMSGVAWLQGIVTLHHNFLKIKDRRKIIVHNSYFVVLSIDAIDIIILYARSHTPSPYPTHAFIYIYICILINK